MSDNFLRALNESIAIRKCLLDPLKWNEEDKKVLPPRYTSVMVHIGLERADMDEELEYFKLILNKDKIALSLHVERSNGCLHWNYLKEVREELSPLVEGGIMTFEWIINEYMK